MSKRKSGRKEIHVVPKGDKWAAKKPGAKRASRVGKRKEDVLRETREQAKKENAELVIHGKDGKIQDSDSYGNDPCPPKDTKH